MKKLKPFLLILALSITLIGCTAKEEKVDSKSGNENSDTEISLDPNDGELLAISHYFPFKENTMKIFQGKGNEYAANTTFIEFIEGNKAQIRTMNDGTESIKVLEYKDGELREIYVEGEHYHIQNMINAKSNYANIVLKEPLKVGTVWANSSGYKMEITSMNQVVETPAGTYEAMEVTTYYDEGRTQKEYYVKDIGLVATLYKDGDFIVETKLEEVKYENLKIDLPVYYPLSRDIELGYINKSIEFATNDSIEMIIENLLKDPQNSKAIAPISKDTIINNIYLDKETWTLDVDFSKDLIEDMNAGSTFETVIIKSLVNTLGKFYDVEKVYISIDGKPYASGHIGIQKGESFDVDTENIQEIK